MTNKTIQKNRATAYHAQQQRCCYCNGWMWHDSLTAFAARFEISEPLARQFKCTAEHLIARQDGGSNSAANIAAACLHCNRQRHRRTAPMETVAYRDFVQKRVAAGKWHPKQAHKQGIVGSSPAA